MSREFMTKVTLIFPKENKTNIEGLVEEQFKNGELNIEKSEDDYIYFYVWNWCVSEESLERYKKFCIYIDKMEFEVRDESCFMWREKTKPKGDGK